MLSHVEEINDQLDLAKLGNDCNLHFSCSRGYRYPVRSDKRQKERKVVLRRKLQPLQRLRELRESSYSSALSIRSSSGR